MTHEDTEICIMGICASTPAPKAKTAPSKEPAVGWRPLGSKEPAAVNTLTPGGVGAIVFLTLAFAQVFCLLMLARYGGGSNSLAVIFGLE